MFALLRRIHTYAGLLGWTIVLIFGIAGLDATVRATFKTPGASHHIKTVAFTVPSNLTDQQVVKAVWKKIGNPFTLPRMSYGLHRDASNDLCFNFYAAGGGTMAVTVLEKQGELRIDEKRANLWTYLDNLHATTPNTPVRDWRIRLWTYYTEFGIWVLMGLALTGVLQWLTSRPRFRWAQITVVGACAAFLVLYFLVR